MVATAESKLALVNDTEYQHAPPELVSLSDGTTLEKTRDAANIGKLVLPYNTLRPTENPSGEHLLITPGLGGIEATTMPLAVEYVKAGHTVTTFDPPRGNLLHNFSLRSLLHPDHLLSQATYLVAKDLHTKHEIEGLTLTGHSMGGPAVIAAAKISGKTIPGVINSLQLIAPAGATGHNLTELAPRAARVIKEELLPNWDLLKQNLEEFTTEAELVLKGMLYIFRNPARTIGETYMVTRSDIRHSLRELSHLGIETTGIFACNDIFFDCERAEENIGTAVDNFVVLDTPSDAGHLSPQLHPRETVLAQPIQSYSDKKYRPEQLQVA